MTRDQRREAEIIPFPIDREVRLVLRTARLLEARDGERANRFWRLEIRRLEARLISQRVPKDEIDRQLIAFSNAVQRELQAAYLVRHQDELDECGGPYHGDAA